MRSRLARLLLLVLMTAAVLAGAASQGASAAAPSLVNPWDANHNAVLDGQSVLWTRENGLRYFKFQTGIDVADPEHAVTSVTASYLLPDGTVFHVQPLQRNGLYAIREWQTDFTTAETLSFDTSPRYYGTWTVRFLAYDAGNNVVAQLDQAMLVRNVTSAVRPTVTAAAFDKKVQRVPAAGRAVKVGYSITLYDPDETAGSMNVVDRFNRGRMSKDAQKKCTKYANGGGAPYDEARVRQGDYLVYRFEFKTCNAVGRHTMKMYSLGWTLDEFDDIYPDSLDFKKSFTVRRPRGAGE